MSSIDTPVGSSSKSEPDPSLGGPGTGAGPLGPLSTGTIVGIITAIALALRLWELGERVMHHDESLDAWWSWRFNQGTYDGYDPVYHGPLRFYITAGFFEMFGRTEAAARLFSALAGTAAVGLVWWLRHELGRVGTIVAAAALCISPTMLYYSRFGREDAQMVFLALLCLVLGISYLSRPRTSAAVGLAFALACSFAIKESTYLFGLLLAVYLAIVVATEFDAAERRDRGQPVDGWADRRFFGSQLGLASVALIITATVGHRSGQLFPLLMVYFVGVAAMVLAASLPQLRRAEMEWSWPRAGLFGVGAAALVSVFRAYRGAAEADTVAMSRPAMLAALLAAGAAIAVFNAPVFHSNLSPRDRTTWTGALLLGAGALVAGGWIDRTVAARALDGEPAVWSVSILAAFVGIVVFLAGAAITFGDRLDLGRITGDDGQAQPTSPIGSKLAIAAMFGGAALALNEFTESEPNRLIAAVVIILVLLACVAIGSSMPHKANADYQWPPTVAAFGAIGWAGWGLTTLAFTVPWYVFFTVFGRFKGDWASGFTKAIEYWDSQQEVNRGGEPWYYYLFALPAYEWLFVALAGLGSWVALRRPTLVSGLFVWFAVGSMVLYSYAGERMPWLIAHPLLPMLVLAGSGSAVLWRNRRHRLASPITIVLVLALLATTATSIRASFVTPTDGRELLSQAAQPTPHLATALERFENIDRLSRQHTGEPATLAISFSEGWPYSWYLLERDNVIWFQEADGPPDNPAIDVIIAKSGEINPDDYPGFEATLFAMRSWWIPPYTDAGVLDWVRWARGLDLWEELPHPNYTPIGDPLPEYVPIGEAEASGEDASIADRLATIQAGADDAAHGWVSTLSADGDAISPPLFASTQPPDGRDGCGSVNQWFLVSREFAELERQVFPDAAAAMGPLDCADDAFIGP